MKPPASLPIPITASALVNALGSDTHTVLARVFAGESALSLPRNWQLPFPTAVGEMPAQLPEVAHLDPRRDSRLVRIAWQAVSQLRAQLDQARHRYGHDRVALVLGSSTGGMAETERAFPKLRRGEDASPYVHDLQHPLAAAAAALQQVLGLDGPSLVVSTACSSSSKALGSARRLLRAGLADCALVVGVDSLCAMTLYGFHSLGVLSPEPALPFAMDRQGISLGEGAAAVLLEPAASSDVYFAGIGESSDAHHLSSPDPEGAGMATAMRAALHDAAIDAAAIGHVNAHGTGTLQNDAVESLALTRLFGRAVPVVSNKAAFGHLLGAGGLSEAVVALESLRRRVVPPLAHSAPADERLGVELVRRAQPCDSRAVLNNSFGFGGSNVSVVLSR